MEERHAWDDGGFLVVTLSARFDPLWDAIDKNEPRPRVGGSCLALGSWRDSLSPPMERDTTSWTLAFTIDASLPEVAFKFALELDDEMEGSEAGGANWRSTRLLWEGGEERTIASGRIQGSLPPHAQFQLQDGSIVKMAVGVTIERTSAMVLARAFRTMESASMAKARKQARDICNRKRQGGFNAAQTLHGSKLMSDREVEVLDEGAGVEYESTAQTLASMAANEMELLSTDISSSNGDGQHVIGLDSGIVDPLSTFNQQTGKSEAIDEGLKEGKQASLQATMHVQNLESDVGEDTHESREILHHRQGIKRDSTRTRAFLSPGPAAAEEAAHMYCRQKTHRCLAIVMVGLPARGKSFTATKLMQYLQWMGYNVRLFNVGQYRRKFHGKATGVGAWIFSAENIEGQEARRLCAKMAMEDMLSWLDQGGQIGIYDATNTTHERRQMLSELARGKCRVIFLESVCTNKKLLEENIREKVRISPDYAGDNEDDAYKDFCERMLQYEKCYQPLESDKDSELSYIKITDLVTGQGKLTANRVTGYLNARICFFLLNLHLKPRRIYFTRHGQSQFNLCGQIGGDSLLSPSGAQYATELASFIRNFPREERVSSIWTSTLRRTIETAKELVDLDGIPSVQWRALDEIDAGVCDGMTYNEIKETMSQEWEARKKDKLRYRYPRGESYLDIVARVEPVIIELERQRAPVLVVAHQAVLRVLYAYFTGSPQENIPFIEMPLHTVIEITPHQFGLSEKRYNFGEAKGDLSDGNMSN